MHYGYTEVQQAINVLTSRLGTGPSSSLQIEYEAGFYPNLLTYDKLEQPSLAVSALTRCLVGAGSYVHQPANFYNIYSTGRCVNMTLFLARAVEVLTSTHVRGVHNRLERLISESRRDAFEAVAFELITAARYLDNDSVTEIEFIDEDSNSMTPDFLAKISGIEQYVECKKLDRTQEHSLAVRNAVREMINPILRGFQNSSRSVLADVTFHADPSSLSGHKLGKTIEVSLRKGVPILDHDFTVTAKMLPKFECSELTLYPSPQFEWERYGYRVRSNWVGLVHASDPVFANLSPFPGNDKRRMSTWIAEILWDSAVKWRISSEEMLAKYRRFPFAGVFKGLRQIDGRGLNSTVHLWLESDYYTDGRGNTFFDLFDRMVSGRKYYFGWLVLNELLFDVSPKGRFDLIEHAHIIRGPTALSSKPLVTDVFTNDGSNYGLSAFGAGADLPDIDLDD